MNYQKYKKWIKVIIVLFLLIIIYELIVRIGYDKDRDIKWGMAFSKPYAIEIGLDWKKLYIDMITDLGVDTVKLSVYWNDVEHVQNNYDFDDYDWMMQQAKENDIEILLVVGQRLPRWPECHRPGWLNHLDQEEQNKQLLNWVKLVVERYKKYDNISMWQVENEPFLTLFGECKKVNPEILKKEVELIKSIDKRPILITDSGELSTWRKSSKVGDYLGSTVYRIVHNPLLGYWGYGWLPASFYRFKARLNSKPWDKMLVSELQTEPWYPDQGSMLNTPLDEQFKSMNPDKFWDNIEYSQKIGFPQSYLWGVEWWGWLKEKHEDDRMWQEAKILFSR